MKKLVVVLAIALVSLGGVTIHLWRQLDAGRQQIAALEARLQAAEAARQASAAALARQAQSIASNAVTPAAPAAPATAPKAAANAASALVEEINRQMTSPEGRDVRRGQRRMMLTQMYPDIGKWLNLSRDEENKLLDLIARQQSDESDVLLDPANRNNPAAQQDAMRKVQAQRQTNDADLAALLGSKYPQYQEYQQTLPLHRQMGQLQAMLGSGADGLSDAQSKSLTTALVAEQLRINQERSGAPLGTAGLSSQEFQQEQQQRTVESDRRLLQVASSQLNPQQLTSYRNLIEQQERTSSALSRTLGIARDAAQGQAGGAAATPP